MDVTAVSTVPELLQWLQWLLLCVVVQVLCGVLARPAHCHCLSPPAHTETAQLTVSGLERSGHIDTSTSQDIDLTQTLGPELLLPVVLSLSPISNLLLSRTSSPPTPVSCPSVLFHPLPLFIVGCERQLQFIMINFSSRSEVTL